MRSPDEDIRHQVSAIFRHSGNFNWDVTLERGLWDREDDFWMRTHTTGNGRESTSRFLSHMDRSIGLEKKTYRLSELKNWTTRCAYMRTSTFLNTLTLPVQPVIVPPLQPRVLNTTAKKTWRSIYQAVADATELFFIGYSLPKEDQFARLVLRRALRSNLLRTGSAKETLRITVVNADDSACRTFARLAGSGVSLQSYQAKFENYLECFNPWSAEE